jgi:hypothetical protein
MTNEIEDLKRDSARLTWLIAEALEGRHHLARAGFDQHSVRAYVDHHMAPANADAERARWCEDRKADVMYLHLDDGRLERVSDPDRNTAIDKARGVAK